MRAHRKAGMFLALAKLTVAVAAFAADPAPSLRLTRDPERPLSGQQTRLTLEIPASRCEGWASVRPILGDGEFVVTETKKAFDGGCRWIWVVAGAKQPVPYLPGLRLREAGKEETAWEPPPGSLEEAVWRHPERFRNEPSCPEFRGEDLLCRDRKSGENVPVPYDLRRQDDGSLRVFYRQDPQVSILKALSGKSAPIDGKVFEFSSLLGLSVPKETRLYRCEGGVFHIHSFTLMAGGETHREFRWAGDKLTVVGTEFRVGCTGPGDGTCMPGTAHADHRELDLECDQAGAGAH